VSQEPLGMIRQAGLSVRRVADAFGVSRSTVYRWCATEPPTMLIEYLESMASNGPLRLAPLASFLEHERTRRRQTIRQFCHHIGVAERSYRSWLRNEHLPALARLSRVASRLQVPALDLIRIRNSGL
jgi:transcriptional regulator with XRE-family HTH domain